MAVLSGSGCNARGFGGSSLRMRKDGVELGAATGDLERCLEETENAFEVKDCMKEGVSRRIRKRDYKVRSTMGRIKDVTSGWSVT